VAYYIVMKYVCSVDIFQSLAQVIVLFNNPDNTTEWMSELVNLELIKGAPSDVGAVSRLTFRTKTLDFDVIETITKKNLPSQFARVYKMRDIALEVNDSFAVAGKHLTRYTSKNEVSFSGLMLPVGWVLKWYFKKRTHKQMKDFKYFAENYVELT